MEQQLGSFGTTFTKGILFSDEIFFRLSLYTYTAKFICKFDGHFCIESAKKKFGGFHAHMKRLITRQIDFKNFIGVPTREAGERGLEGGGLAPGEF